MVGNSIDILEEVEKFRILSNCVRQKNHRKTDPRRKQRG